MRITAADDLGQSLLTTGVNDLTITESLFRMASEGELAVDVGANVGYTTSVLAAGVGSSGRVVSFEPHPAIFAELTAHIAGWEAQGSISAGHVNAVNSAVSAFEGVATLVEPEGFNTNRGRSSLQDAAANSGPRSQTVWLLNGHAIQTNTVTLDEALKCAGFIGVLKVDVEGHEEQVFAGAKRLLRSGQIRDIAFEEFELFPARTHSMLQEYGYHVFVVEEHLRGPRLVSADPSWRAPKYSPPNYLATLDPDRLINRFITRGWLCLNPVSSS